MKFTVDLNLKPQNQLVRELQELVQDTSDLVNAGKFQCFISMEDFHKWMLDELNVIRAKYFGTKTREAYCRIELDQLTVPDRTRPIIRVWGHQAANKETFRVSYHPEWQPDPITVIECPEDIDDDLEFELV